MDYLHPAIQPFFIILRDGWGGGKLVDGQTDRDRSNSGIASKPLYFVFKKH